MATGETLVGPADDPFEDRSAAFQAGVDFREFFAYPRSFTTEAGAREVDRGYADEEEDYRRTEGGPDS